MSANEMITFLTNFITVAGTTVNEEILGYTASDITALTTEKNNLMQTALADQKNKQDAAKSATVALNTLLKAARAGPVHAQPQHSGQRARQQHAQDRARPERETAAPRSA